MTQLPLQLAVHFYLLAPLVKKLQQQQVELLQLMWTLQLLLLITLMLTADPKQL
jgi:hypothetical protein